MIPSSSRRGSVAAHSPERFGDVAAPRERFHQEAVSGLAVGCKLGQHPGEFLGLGQRRAAEAEAGGGKALQPAQPDLVQPASPFVDPGCLKAGEERPGGDVVGDPGRAPCLRPASLRDGGLGPVGAFQGRLDVDEDRWREEQFDLGPSVEMLGAQAVPQLGQQDTQRVSRLRGGVLSPAYEHVSRGWAATVRRTGEHDPPNAAGSVFVREPSIGDATTAGFWPSSTGPSGGPGRSPYPCRAAGIQENEGERRPNGPGKQRP
jgi:hypothetical protein